MKRILLGFLLLSVLACGDKQTAAKLTDLQTRNEDLNQRITKLENDLNDTKKQIIQMQQAVQTMNDRVKTVETSVDKLAYASTQH